VSPTSGGTGPAPDGELSRQQGGLTTPQVIRECSLRLFAEHGPDTVSTRQVAAAAGVSPRLVRRHFGSLAGLREAVDDHVAEVVENLLATVTDADQVGIGLGGSVAAAIIGKLPADSPIPAYLRRLLMCGDRVGYALVARWYSVAERTLDEMTDTGVVRPAHDPPARAAFLMANDLAVLLLRDQLTFVLGTDPLTNDGATRWADSVFDVYHDGVFRPGRDRGPLPPGRPAR
jgi:AcrR family transcriptional regulator